MSDWLHSLAVVWMAVAFFGFTYMTAALIYAVVVLPARVRLRAKGFAAGMLSCKTDIHELKSTTAGYVFMISGITQLQNLRNHRQAIKR